MTRHGPTIDELLVADDCERWAKLGFKVADECCELGEVRVRFCAEPGARGIVGWSLRDIASTELDGLPTTSQSNRRGAVEQLNRTGSSRSTTSSRCRRPWTAASKRSDERALDYEGSGKNRLRAARRARRSSGWGPRSWS